MLYKFDFILMVSFYQLNFVVMCQCHRRSKYFIRLVFKHVLLLTFSVNKVVTTEKEI